jgi:hypothetical protein
MVTPRAPSINSAAKEIASAVLEALPSKALWFLQGERYLI